LRHFTLFISSDAQAEPSDAAKNFVEKYHWPVFWNTILVTLPEPDARDPGIFAPHFSCVFASMVLGDGVSTIFITGRRAASSGPVYALEFRSSGN
jgi:hypothetical protein